MTCTVIKCTVYIAAAAGCCCWLLLLLLLAADAGFAVLADLLAFLPPTDAQKLSFHAADNPCYSSGSSCMHQTYNILYMFTWPTYTNSILQICHLVPYACTYVGAAASMGGVLYRRYSDKPRAIPD